MQIRNAELWAMIQQENGNSEEGKCFLGELRWWTLCMERIYLVGGQSVRQSLTHFYPQWIARSSLSRYGQDYFVWLLAQIWGKPDGELAEGELSWGEQLRHFHNDRNERSELNSTPGAVCDRSTGGEFLVLPLNSGGAAA